MLEQYVGNQFLTVFMNDISMDNAVNITVATKQPWNPSNWEREMGVVQQALVVNS
jgi:hypothetical protein